MMKRRQFFQLVGSLGLALAVPKTANAQVISLKGCVLNNAVSPYHQTISAASDWVRMDTSKWISDSSIQIGCKVAFDLSSKIPDTLTIQTVVARPEYDHWWLCLNEPDLEGLTPQAAATLVTTQKNNVLAVDPHAKFAVSIGIYLHPVYKANSWGQQFLTALSDKRGVAALHTHQYPSPLLIAPYLSSLNTWRKAHYPTMELWLTEIGRGVNYAGTNYTPANIQLHCNRNNIARWAWYAQYAETGYVCLEDANGLTLTGQQYINL